MLQCPKCKYEYRSGFTRCPVCRSPLAEKPEPLADTWGVSVYGQAVLVDKRDLSAAREIMAAYFPDRWVAGDDPGDMPPPGG